MNVKTKKKSLTPKATVGGVKKIASKKMWALSIMIVVLITGVGYGGWYVWRGHQMSSAKAHAASWELIGDNTLNARGYVPANKVRFTAAACKTSVSSKYGPLWQVSVLVVKGDKSASGYAEVHTDGPGYASGSEYYQGSSQWWMHNMQLYKFYVSQILTPNAYIQVTAQTPDTFIPGKSYGWSSGSLTNRATTARTNGKTGYVLVKGLWNC